MKIPRAKDGNNSNSKSMIIETGHVKRFMG
jgi:hypothetical protein